MNFKIDYTGLSENRILIYNFKESSFDMEPTFKEIDFDIVLNEINLTVVDNKIAQLWGFSGHKTWLDTSFDVPQSKKGVLKISDSLEPGFSYRIQREFPVFFNKKTGWICIGKPELKKNAVEFIDSCIAVLDDLNELGSIWLKPIFT